MQRERARKHANELEAENRRLADQGKAQHSELRKLQADNLRLYEKARFLEATAGAAGGGGKDGGRKDAAADVEKGDRHSIVEASTD